MKKLTIAAIFLLLTTWNLFARQQHVIKTEHLKSADTVWVFTPEQYAGDNTARFPVVYLLHGWNGSYHQWNDITNCQQLADKYGFIIVCPDGLTDSWYINSPAVRKSRYVDFFFLDLMPFIAKTYRIDPAGVFITGLSMGGHGALYLFSKRPAMFRSAGSLSGVVDLSEVSQEYGINRYTGIDGKPDSSGVLKAFSVSGNIEAIASSGKEIILSCGYSDRFYPMNSRFMERGVKLKMQATYIVTPGGHDYPYWRSAIGDQMDFFKKRIKAGITSR